MNELKQTTYSLEIMMQGKVKKANVLNLFQHIRISEQILIEESTCTKTTQKFSDVSFGCHHHTNDETI